MRETTVISDREYGISFCIDYGIKPRKGIGGLRGFCNITEGWVGIRYYSNPASRARMMA